MGVFHVHQIFERYGIYDIKIDYPEPIIPIKSHLGSLDLLEERRVSMSAEY